MSKYLFLIFGIEDPYIIALEYNNEVVHDIHERIVILFEFITFVKYFMYDFRYEKYFIFIIENVYDSQMASSLIGIHAYVSVHYMGWLI